MFRVVHDAVWDHTTRVGRDGPHDGERERVHLAFCLIGIEPVPTKRALATPARAQAQTRILVGRRAVRGTRPVIHRTPRLCARHRRIEIRRNDTLRPHRRTCVRFRVRSEGRQECRARRRRLEFEFV